MKKMTPMGLIVRLDNDSIYCVCNDCSKFFSTLKGVMSMMNEKGGG